MSDTIARLNAALSDRYRLERELGAGGMATVYLAHDVKHDRHVALKVLKPELAAVVGAERFLAEIRTTANLQHPHILPLFDSGEADSFLYFVMPYVEGESLRDRLDREGELPVDGAVRMATAVGSALDYAHRHGVIHRDIKPANILLHDGEPLVADFGIALAVSAAGGGRLTETGLSLGTPYYMSPEQATGERDPDSRSDVYALGCVLYEMLVGEPPYTGSSAQAVLGRILTTDPVRPTEHRRTVPAHVEAAVLKALEKRPADRFGSAADLVEALSSPSTHATPLVGGEKAPVERGRLGGEHHPLGLLGWVVALALTAVWLYPDGSPEGSLPPLLDVDLLLADSAPLLFVGEAELNIGRPSLALSPDGSWLAYVGRWQGRSRLMARRLDRREDAVRLSDTEGAYGPVFSPDGDWIAFFVGDELKKVAADGRSVVSLARLRNNHGMTWAPDGSRILVSTDEGTNMMWVPTSGGDPVPALSEPMNVRWPAFLPDGRHVVVSGGSDDALTVVNLESGGRFLVTLNGVSPSEAVPDVDRLTALSPRYVESGHLVYTRWDGTLMALPFDAQKLEVQGAPAPVLSGLRMEAYTGAGQFGFSARGTLVYAPGSNAAIAPLVWVDLSDQSVDTLPFRPRLWGGFDLSPDGGRVIAQVAQGESLDALVEFDLSTGTETVVPTGGSNLNPWWWPDGRTVVYFEQDRDTWWGPTMRQRLGTAREWDTLTADGNASDVSPDGLWLAVGNSAGIPGIRLESTEPGGDTLLLHDGTYSWGPAFSPDGRWVAFTSSEAGVYDMYAVALPFTPGDRRMKVSQDGGLEGMWTAQGDLVYRVDRRIVRVRPPPPGGTTFGSPEVLFEGPLLDVAYRGHDLSPDGERLLLVLGTEVDTTNRLHVVTDWFARLERLAPRGGR